MKVIIDRFEGDFAVCEKEDRAMVNIEKSKLPEGVREGDVLVNEGDRFFVDQDETQERKKRIRQMMDSLWK
jgi:hypothetical protein